MILWLLVNTTISLLALLFLLLNRDAPHRFRFHVCFMVLCSWLIPWNLVAGMLPVTTLPLPAISISDFSMQENIVVGGSGAGVSSSPVLENILPGLWTGLLALLVGIGCFRFLYSLHRQHGLIRRLKGGLSEKTIQVDQLPMIKSLPGYGGNLPPVRVQREMPGAFTTGFFKPVIWLHEELLDNSALETVILHELTHVTYHDNLYLLVLTFVESMFWWNPLALLLARRARNLQELGCDAACLQIYPGYRSNLNHLVLKLSKESSAGCSNPQALCSGMFKDVNFNVERVRQLNRRYIMLTKHYFTSGAFGVCAVLLIACTSVFSQDVNDAEREYSQEELAAIDANRSELERRAAEAEEEVGPVETEAGRYERRVRVGLEMYAEKLEQSWEELNEENERLATRLAELEQNSAE